MSLLQHLVDKIQESEDYKASQPCYVSVYRHHRCFGGPEEGGWWYDVHEFEGGIPFLSREEAEQFLEKSKAEVEAANREEAPARYRAMESLPDEDEVTCPAGYSEGYIPKHWHDGGKLSVVVEDKMGEQDNSKEPRPHYE